MTIHTKCEDTFFKCIYELTVKGLTFQANADTLTVTLTGGH